MALLRKLFAAGRALKAGESLQNPENWKRFQILAPYIAVLITVGCQLAGVPIDDIQIKSSAEGIATLSSLLFNHYFTVATTRKISL